MSFQDLQGNESKLMSRRSASQSPSQAVAAGIFQINTAVATLRRLVDAIGTVKDTPEHRQKLHDARQRVLQLVKETSAKLKNLSESDRDATPSKKIEDAKLAKDFQSTLQEFQKIQQLASERESNYAPVAPPSSSSTQTQSDSGEYLESGVDQERQAFLGEQKRREVLHLGNEIAFNEAIIDEREQGILEIQEQIGQTNEIFKDLAVLIHDQGVVIDDIHSNIDTSSTSTTQARVQLARASKSVKSKHSWCWWILVIIVLVLVILLIYLVV